MNLVSGWTIPPEGVDYTASLEFVIILQWESIDEMYNVKNDENPLFNNAFAPLTSEASGGSKPVLYTKLRTAHEDHAKCLKM